MSKKITKKISLSIPAILICISLVFGFYIFFTKASTPAKVQFTVDAIVSLSGIADGDLYISQNSEADSLSISGSTLTVGDIFDGLSFTLKTSEHDNALKITSSGGTLDFTFESGNFSSGNITQWTLEGSGSTQAVHIVGTPEANKWYAVKINGVLLNNYQSNSSSEVSFTYSGDWSLKTFTIENGSAPGGGLSPTVYNLPIKPESTAENLGGGFNVLINNGANTTDSQAVTLKFYTGADTKRMAISNTSDFKNASQISYQEEIIWELSECDTRSFTSLSLVQEGRENICTVYVKFYTQYGVSSEVVLDSIIYSKLNVNIPEGSLVKVKNDYKIYIKKGSYLRHIPNPTIFSFYSHFRWDNIRIITQQEFSQFQISTLVREFNDKKVYQINDSNLTKHHLNITAKKFENSGRSWGMIYIINERERDFYEVGEEIGE